MASAGAKTPDNLCCLSPSDAVLAAEELRFAKLSMRAADEDQGYVEPVKKQQKQRRGLLPKAVRFARASGIVK